MLGPGHPHDSLLWEVVQVSPCLLPLYYSICPSASLLDSCDQEKWERQAILLLLERWGRWKFLKLDYLVLRSIFSKQFCHVAVVRVLFHLSDFFHHCPCSILQRESDTSCTNARSAPNVGSMLLWLLVGPTKSSSIHASKRIAVSWARSNNNYW